MHERRGTDIDAIEPFMGEEIFDTAITGDARDELASEMKTLGERINDSP
jgi:hypothetical protein